MFNEGRKQRGSGRKNETQEQALARVRAERAARQHRKSQATSVHKVQSFVRGRICVSHFRKQLVRDFDAQLQCFRSDLLNNDLAKLINTFNWARLSGPECTKRLVGVAALLVKSSKQPGGYLTQLSIDPLAPASARSLVRFLSTCLDKLSAGQIPVPVEVIVLKCMNLVIDPALHAGVPATVSRLVHLRLHQHGLCSAMMAVVQRSAPLSEHPDKPSGCVETAFQIATRPSPGMTQCEASIAIVQDILSAPCLARRIPLSDVHWAWNQLVAILSTALPSGDTQIVLGHSKNTWLLGNLIDLVVSGDLSGVVSDPRLSAVLYAVIADLWQRAVPKKTCLAGGWDEGNKHGGVWGAGCTAARADTAC